MVPGGAHRGAAPELLNNLGRVPRIALCAALLAALALLAGCSLKADSADSGDDGGGGTFGAAPQVGAKPDDKEATEKLGFPFIATRNTTRVAGSDPVADA